LLCIDVKGAKAVSRKFPQAIKIFIKTPSVKILAQRLKARGSEGSKDLALRLKTARAELREAKNYPYIIVNSSLAKAYGELEGIISKNIL